MNKAQLVATLNPLVRASEILIYLIESPILKTAEGGLNDF